MKNMKLGTHKLIFFIFTLFISIETFADTIEGKFVELQILDKITARVETIIINVNEFLNNGRNTVLIWSNLWIINHSRYFMGGE